MTRKVRSAKGEIVDFDYLKIKEQLAAAPTPTDVKTRQNFIENRMKRRMKKKVDGVGSSGIDVEPKLPEPAEEVAAEEAVPVEETKTTTKQKARKKTTEE